MANTGKKVGVVLSGCGFLDGAEIQEAALTLLALDRAGAQALALAPDVEQMHVIDHAHGKPSTGEKRNVLAESARIVRGKIEDIARVYEKDFDALVFVGGFGAAKNLSSFAVDGTQMRVNPEVERLIRETFRARKPMGFICISPVIAAKVLGDHRPHLTVGNDRETAAAIRGLGGVHVERKVDEIEVDKANKLVSTPAYMLGPSIAPVAAGIEKLVAALLELA